MKSKSTQVFRDHDPNYITFPLAEEGYHEKDTGEAIPSEQSIKEVKDWVEYKEM